MANVSNWIPVRQLEITRDGQLQRKQMDLGREAQLGNSLIQALFPGVRVATIDVPREPLTPFEQGTVEEALTRIVDQDGTRFSLAGASGSAKNGKFYAVERSYAAQIAERFRHSPQAAITYFGILVSSCKVMIEEPDCRLLLVEDHQLGTNDCRGWISESLFRKLQKKHNDELLEREVEELVAQRNEKLAPDEKNSPLTPEERPQLVQQARHRIWRKLLRENRFYQFRLTFEKTQAKGSFKVMGDDVAEKLEADIIIPRSSVKPKWPGGHQGSLTRTVISSPTGRCEGLSFRGPLAVGLRDVSRNLEFSSSYTLVEHAPESSIELEIKPYAIQQIEKLRKAYEERDFSELFKLIGAQESQEVLDVGEEVDPGFTCSSYNMAAGALLADATGYFLQHPFVHSYLEKVLAEWAYRLCTSGGFRLPGFVLADDGYLLLHDRQVFWGSDWLPQNRAYVQLESDRGLVVRFPIRMKEDLLPFERLSSEALARLLGEDLEKHDCQITENELARVAEQQLQLAGTLVLHSQMAARNGGDFDFDMVCVVESNQFPRFVQDRFEYQESHASQKTKMPKPPSPWWNLPQVAMQARGNKIGAITDLKTSCLALGRTDLARVLVDELQNALDQLKHGTQPDQEVITKIREEVPKAPWLELKLKERISEMPEHLEVPGTDRIGKLYNYLRKELGRFLDPGTVLPLSDFRGAIEGVSFTQEIYEECRNVNLYYAACIAELIAKRDLLSAKVDRTRAERDAAVANDLDKEAQAQARFRWNQAWTEFQHYNTGSFKEDMSAVISMVRDWAKGKNGNRLAYLSALHFLVCKDVRRKPEWEERTKGRGSILFYAFPQEMVDLIAARTGGRPVSVDVPELCDGIVVVDREGRLFLVKEPTDVNHPPERLVELGQVKRNGEIVLNKATKDGMTLPLVSRRIRPFLVEPGRSEIRNGRLVFPGTIQRPQVPMRKDGAHNP
jgi:hypothetical protein